MRRRPLILGLAAAVLVLLALGIWHTAATWRPAADAFPVQGVDVSADTGAIDWPTAHARGVDFAYVRAIGADTRRDAAFEGHWAALEASALRRGALQQWSLCHAADVQARAFITFVPRVADALPAALALDFDPACAARPPRAQVLAAIRAYLAAVEHHTGRPMLLKIAPAFEDEYQVSAAILRPLWASGDFFFPDYLAKPWRIWQANASRRVEGIERPVHWNAVRP